MQMSNPMQAWNTWCALSLQAARLGWEAQSVIALRMMGLATQSAGSQTEARRMVTEKVAAFAEAQAAAAGAARAARTIMSPRKSWAFTRSAFAPTGGG
jgi:hypothetical protein